MGKNGLSKKELKAIKRILTAKQQVIQEDMIQAKKGLLEECLPEPNRSKTHIADSNGGPSVYQARVTNLQKCLWKIDEAFENLENGSYGICKNCGDPIPPERLKIVPFTQLHVECKF
jgi:RNA polymerase-binding protein DksA